MKTKTIATAAASIALLFALTACTSTTAAQHVPAATDSPAAVASSAPAATPTTAATAAASTDNEWGVDTSKVVIPADVTAAYGADVVKTLVPRALTVSDIAVNEMAQLHHKRDGANDKAIITSTLSPYMTQEAIGVLNGTDASLIDGLVPSVNPDGTTLPGCEATGDGLRALMQTTPQVAITQVRGQQVVQVTMHMGITAYCTTGNIELNRELRLYMIPDGSGNWLVNSWGYNTTYAGK